MQSSPHQMQFLGTQAKDKQASSHRNLCKHYYRSFISVLTFYKAVYKSFYDSFITIRDHVRAPTGRVHEPNGEGTLQVALLLIFPHTNMYLILLVSLTRIKRNCQKNTLPLFLSQNITEFFSCSLKYAVFLEQC